MSLAALLRMPVLPLTGLSHKTKLVAGAGFEPTTFGL